MPSSASRSKPVRRKRRRVKRYRRRKNMQLVNMNPGRSSYTGWPAEMLFKHKYSNRFTVAAVSTSNIFRVNSLYDPDYTGVGSKTTNFDETFAVYSRATVYAAKVNLTFVPNSSCTPILLQLAYSGGSGTAGVDPLLYTASLPNTKRQYISGSAGTVKISMLIDLRKKIGRQVMTDFDYSHGSSNSPTQSQYFVVDTLSLDGTTAAAGSMIVDVTYYALHNNLLPSVNQTLD